MTSPAPGAEPLEWYEVPTKWYPMFDGGGAKDWYGNGPTTGAPWYLTDWYDPTYTPA